MGSDQSQLKVGDTVRYRASKNGQWIVAQIVDMDDESGQFGIRLNNGFEIQSLPNNKNDERRQNKSNNGRRQNKNNNGRRHGKNNNQSRQNLSYNPHAHDQHNCHDHGNYGSNNGRQSFKQKQVKRQDQMTVRTQLLLDDTEQQCTMIKDYLDGVRSGKSKDELKKFNQKVVAGLTLFDMKVDAMRANGKSENLDFNDAFKASAMIVKKFENECKSQFGRNQFLMQRLEPCLNYMRAVLYGKKVPALPYINEYEFNQQIAGDIISQVNYAQNHVMPERMKKINDNNGHYKQNQQKLKKEYESGGYNDKVHEVDYKNLIQDYGNKNIAFGVSKEEYNRINNQDRFRYQQPDLMNGDGMDCDQY